MNGQDFVDAARREVIAAGGSGTERQIADYLGMTVMSVSNWRKREEITIRQMIGLIASIKRKTAKQIERNTIKPVVEFFRLAPVATRSGGGREIFGTNDESGQQHPYREGLRNELEKHHGVYVFYDSRGRALYVGKARQQSLWKEINLAFNRDRKVQKIRRVDHPERRLDFRTSDEKTRQIRERAVTLYDLAVYFSAYQVADDAINDLESLLIRGFPNDLLNVRMENLRWKSSPS